METRRIRKCVNRLPLRRPPLSRAGDALRKAADEAEGSLRHGQRRRDPTKSAKDSVLYPIIVLLNPIVTSFSTCRAFASDK